jgi:fructan beta-fructosidase
LSDFGKENGAHGGVWECPDLFKLKVGESDEEKWVLLISINPGAPNGGSGTQYFVGNFDGKKFTAEHKDHKWLDWGTDNYAGVTYNNTSNNERIFIGWMSNWNYARNTPTERWRSAMTLPRELSLINENGHYFLQSNVMEAFNKQVSKVSEQEIISLESPFDLDYENFNQSEVSFKTNLSKQLKLQFTNKKNEKLIFEIDPLNKKMTIDRMASGLVAFEPSFAKDIHALPYTVSNKEVDVRIIMDWSSVEIFVDDGKYVMTDQIFPTEFYNNLQVSSIDQIRLKNFNLNNIKSIWKDE